MNKMKYNIYLSILVKVFPQQILWLPTIDHEEIIILGLDVESGVYMGHVVPSLRVHFLDVLIWISFSICISFVQTFVLHLLSVSYQEMKHFWCTCRCVLKKVDNKKVLQRPGNKELFFIRRKSIENYTLSNKERQFGVVMRTRMTWIGNKYYIAWICYGVQSIFHMEH